MVGASGRHETPAAAPTKPADNCRRLRLCGVASSRCASRLCRPRSASPQILEELREQRFLVGGQGSLAHRRSEARVPFCFGETIDGRGGGLARYTFEIVGCAHAPRHDIGHRRQKRVDMPEPCGVEIGAHQLRATRQRQVSRLRRSRRAAAWPLVQMRRTSTPPAARSAAAEATEGFSVTNAHEPSPRGHSQRARTRGGNVTALPRGTLHPLGRIPITVKPPITSSESTPTAPHAARGRCLGWILPPATSTARTSPASSRP
jgi:hypothetical protein